MPTSSSLRISVDLGSAHDFEASPLQLRGVVKNALVDALASRGVRAEVDADSPDVVLRVARELIPAAEALGRRSITPRELREQLAQS